MKKNYATVLIANESDLNITRWFTKVPQIQRSEQLILHKWSALCPRKNRLIQKMTTGAKSQPMLIWPNRVQFTTYRHYGAISKSFWNLILLHIKLWVEKK